MKVFVFVLCLSMLVAMAFAGKNPLAATCNSFCGDTCKVSNQLLSLFEMFLGHQLIETIDQVCHQACDVMCGFLG
ncbi:hypothetical protein RRG08_042990 [Elysia crispata]|uniref:Saposin B-type domain-containing protein n=1 Tax=Elysia crispata TaxID=231223 RepID=A0AAE1CPD6_9GAST|nr:hypothetical protein RRG08_042990 [Elysia crispata]